MFRTVLRYDYGLTVAVPLRPDTLDRLRGRVAVPEYDRTALRPGVVHLSVGAFHRSHQAVFFDDLARLGHRDWGLVGVGLRRPEMGHALVPQAGLYTVVARGAAGDEARIVGAMTRYRYAPRARGAVLAALGDPRARLVTLTITAGAYEERSSVALELLVDGLDARRREGLAPFTVLSCDNLPGNGAVARDAVLACARRRCPRLAAWIAERVAFPSSMVDRITPATTDADRRFVEQAFGVRDRWPVITEPFSQWVVEDAFAGERPPLDEVGVQFVRDVRPYALAKTRLLNATHAAIGHLGALAGLRRADEAMRDPFLGPYVERLMADEVSPLLPPAAGIDLPVYRRALLTRLANPVIGDDLARLRRAGEVKVRAHLLPSIAEARARRRPHPLLTLAVAAWRAETRHRTAEPLLPGDPGFAVELEAAVRALARDGVRAAIAAELDRLRIVA